MECIYESFFGEKTKPVEIDLNKKIYEPFKLPIEYVNSSEIHNLSNTVIADLELAPIESQANEVDIKTEKSEVMYKYLFKPKHDFAEKMLHEWKRKYTTCVPFLIDSQSIIKDLGMINKPKYDVNCENLMKIWKDVKEDSAFLEKYSYIEWEMFKYLNDSSQFLQALTIVNLSSPVLSFIIPFIFLLFPFIILKIQKVPITFSVYITTLKTVAKNHFIGKTLSNLNTLSWDKVIYLLCTIGLYMIQMYQNVNLCIRFYKNVNKINTYLCDIREYVDYSIYNMESFIKVNKNKETYRAFCNDIDTHCQKLKLLQNELKPVNKFAPNITKVTEVGYLLKCFYHLHSDVSYEESLRYSFGFEGYLSNLYGVYENIESNNISFAEYCNDKNCEISEQYYPPYMESEHVKNDASFKKNAIITGPNAAGKTTYLKSTVINIIFTQQIGCGFYKTCTLNPYTHIHSYLNIPDTSGRDSLFQAESRRCKDIIDIIEKYKEKDGYRHFCIFDELYSGTNPIEATKSAYGFLLYLEKFKNVNFILTTHYTSICKKLGKTENVKNYKMDVIELENGAIKYTYKLKKGISKVQGAIKILEEMKYPEEIINNIKLFDNK